jgi:hypothetical protein
MEGAVSRGIERDSADGLEGVVKMQEMYGVRRVLQIANKVCIMEGPCSGAHPPLLQFSPLHRFNSFSPRYSTTALLIHPSMRPPPIPTTC